jgi:hypothetical protein
MTFTGKLGLVRSFDADSELDENDANAYYKDLSRVREVNRIGSATAVGKLMEGKIDIDSITAGKFMSETLEDMVLNNEYVKSYDSKGNRDIDSSEITSGSLRKSGGLLEVVAEAFRTGEGSTVAQRVLDETGLTLESVVAYGMTNHWNQWSTALTSRMLDRVSELFPAHGEGGHAPLADVVGGYERDVIRSRELFPDRVVDTFLRSVYNNTQSALSKAGVTEVTVVRGIGINDPELFRKPDGSDFESVQIDVRLRSLSSYSGNGEDAVVFGNMIFVTKVPASSVFSTALTGFGTTGEAEVIVLGGTYRSTVFQNAHQVGLVDKLNGMIDA